MRQAGFSLLELLVVLTLIAILASIAFPRYSSHMREARRTDAQAGLYAAAQQLERCYTRNHSYADCNFSTRSPDGLYNIELSPDSDATQYSLVASLADPHPGNDEQCSGANAMTLNQQGRQTPESCW